MSTGLFPDLELEEQQDANALIHLGSKHDTVSFCGHVFGLRILHPNEELAAAIAVKDWRGTIKEPEAWAYVQVALALTSVDGDEDFCPQATPDLVAYAKARLNYVGSEWLDPTLNFLFGEYTRLQTEALEKVREIQDLSTGSLSSFSPSLDSSTEPGTSPEETNTEIQPLG